MNAMKHKTAWLMFGAMSLVVLGGMGNVAWGQQEASELDVSEASEFIGTWAISMDFGDMTLTVVDIGGKVGATLESDQMPAPQVITDITKTDEGVEFAFDSDFGRLLIAGKVEGGTFSGTLGDDAGNFSVDFTGEKATTDAASGVEAFLGTWNISMEFGDMTLTITQSGGELAAELVSAQSPDPQKIDEITPTDTGLKLAFDSDFGRIIIEAAIEDGKLVGTLGDDAGNFSTDITGERAEGDAASSFEAFLGTWNISMEFGDMTLTITESGGELAAQLISPQSPDPQDIDEITPTDTGLRLAFDSDFGRIVIEAAIEDGKLVGTLGDDAGNFSTGITGEKDATAPGVLSEEEVTDAEVAEAVESGDEEARQRQRRRRRRGRNTTKIDHGEMSVSIAYGNLPVDGPDFSEVASTDTGSILATTRSAATKLRTEVNLKFGDVLIKTENVAKNYPGVYSLWLKRTAGGWNMVFNERPDVWGTQHTDEADVAEIPLDYTNDGAPNEKFEVKLEETGSDSGVLTLAWGSHVWTAKFDIVMATAADAE